MQNKQEASKRAWDREVNEKEEASQLKGIQFLIIF